MSDDDPTTRAHQGKAGAPANLDHGGRSPAIRAAGQARSVRVQCECGGQLGILNLPTEEQSFHAVCPGCGTRYRWALAALLARADTGSSAILPRARPRG